MAAIVAADAAANADAAAAVDPSDIVDYVRIAYAYEEAVDAAHCVRARSVLVADVLRAQRIHDAGAALWAAERSAALASAWSAA